MRRHSPRKILPTVEAHLTKINQIAADSGVKK